jgi:hypothetical protein
MATKEKPFNYGQYAKQAQVKGQWGVPDPAGTARGRLAQFRRGLTGIGVARNKFERWAMQSEPGKEAAGISAGIGAEQDRMMAQRQKISERATRQQIHRSQQPDSYRYKVGEHVYNPEKGYKEYKETWHTGSRSEDTEARRVGTYTAFGKDTGWDADVMYDYQHQRGKHYEQSMTRLFMSNPENAAKTMESLYDWFDDFDKTLWTMAIFNGMNKFGDVSSLEGVTYFQGDDPAAPNYDPRQAGLPVLKTPEQKGAYAVSLAAARSDKMNNAVEKFGELKAKMFTLQWAKSQDVEGWDSVGELLTVRKSPEAKKLVGTLRNYTKLLLQSYSIPNDIIDLAINPACPMDIDTLARIPGIGIKIDTLLTPLTAAVFGYSISDDELIRVIYDESTDRYKVQVIKVPTTEETKAPSATIASQMEGTYWDVSGLWTGEEALDFDLANIDLTDSATATEEVEPAEVEEAVEDIASEVEEVTVWDTDPSLPEGYMVHELDGDERRVRDWSVDQVLSTFEMQSYFDGYEDLPADATFVVRKDGDSYQIISQTISGHTFNYSGEELSSVIDPDGNELTPEEYEAMVADAGNFISAAKFALGGEHADYYEFVINDPRYVDENGVFIGPIMGVPGTEYVVKTPEGFADFMTKEWDTNVRIMYENPNAPGVLKVLEDIVGEDNPEKYRAIFQSISDWETNALTKTALGLGMLDTTDIELGLYESPSLDYFNFAMQGNTGIILDPVEAWGMAIYRQNDYPIEYCIRNRELIADYAYTLILQSGGYMDGPAILDYINGWHGDRLKESYDGVPPDVEQIGNIETGLSYRTYNDAGVEKQLYTYTPIHQTEPTPLTGWMPTFENIGDFYDHIAGEQGAMWVAGNGLSLESYIFLENVGLKPNEIFDLFTDKYEAPGIYHGRDVVDSGYNIDVWGAIMNVFRATEEFSVNAWNQFDMALHPDALNAKAYKEAVTQLAIDKYGGGTAHEDRFGLNLAMFTGFLDPDLVAITNTYAADWVKEVGPWTNPLFLLPVGPAVRGLKSLPSRLLARTAEERLTAKLITVNIPKVFERTLLRRTTAPFIQKLTKGRINLLRDPGESLIKWGEKVGIKITRAQKTPWLQSYTELQAASRGEPLLTRAMSAGGFIVDSAAGRFYVHNVREAVNYLKSIQKPLSAGAMKEQASRLGAVVKKGGYPIEQEFPLLLAGDQYTTRLSVRVAKKLAREVGATITPATDGYIIEFGDKVIRANSLIEATFYLKYGSVDALGLLQSGLHLIEKVPMTHLDGTPFLDKAGNPITTIVYDVQKYEGLLSTQRWFNKIVKRSQYYKEGDIDAIFMAIKDSLTKGELNPTKVLSFAVKANRTIIEAGIRASSQYMSILERECGYPFARNPASELGEKAISKVRGKEVKRLYDKDGRFVEGLDWDITKAKYAEAEAKGITLPRRSATGEISDATGDVAQYWRYYGFKHEGAAEFLMNFEKLEDSLRKLALSHGVDIGYVSFKDVSAVAHFFPRQAIGIKEFDAIKMTHYDPTKKRVYDFMIEGMDDGIKYGTLFDSMQSYIKSIYRSIGREYEKKIVSAIRTTPASLTAQGKMLVANLADSKKYYEQSDRLLQIIKDFKDVPSFTRKTKSFMTRQFPEVYEEIKNITRLETQVADTERLSSIIARMDSIIQRGAFEPGDKQFFRIWYRKYVKDPQMKGKYVKEAYKNMGDVTPEQIFIDIFEKQRVFKRTQVMEMAENLQKLYDEVNLFYEKLLQNPGDFMYNPAKEAVPDLLTFERMFRQKIEQIVVHGKPYQEVFADIPKKLKYPYKDLLDALKKYEKFVKAGRAKGEVGVEGKVYYRGESSLGPVDEGMYGKGMYFTSDKSYAEAYAQKGVPGVTGELIERRINLKNPFITTKDGAELKQIRNKSMVSSKGMPYKERQELAAQAIRDEIESRGHDGIILKYGKANEEVVVFYPEKSVSEVTTRMQEAQLENIDNFAREYLTKTFHGLEKFKYELTEEAQTKLNDLIETVTNAQAEAKAVYKMDKAARAEYFKRVNSADYILGQASVDIPRYRNWVFNAVVVKERALTPAAIRDVGLRAALKTDITAKTVSLRGLKIPYGVQLKQKIYAGDELARIIEHTLEPEVNAWLKFMYKFTRFQVTGMTVMDFSAPLTFGQLLMSNPLHFTKAAGLSFMTMIHPRMLAMFRVSHRGTYDKMIQAGMKTASDFEDMYAGLGVARSAVARMPILKDYEAALLAPLSRSSLAFSSFTEYGRVYLAESMESSWLAAGGTRAGLAEFVNIATCQLPDMARPASRNVLMAEGALAFAPNYLRSHALLLYRLGGNGIMGSELRKLIIKQWAAWEAIYLGFWFGLECEGTPHVLPWDPHYLQFEKNGQTYGLGGFLPGLSRTMAKILAIATDNPGKLISFDADTWQKTVQEWDDLFAPAWRYAGYKMAPGFNFMREMVTGRDIFGRRLEDKEDYMEAVMSAWMPMLASNLMYSDAPVTPLSFMVNALALQNYPASAATRLRDYAQEYLKTVDPTLLPDYLAEKQMDGTLTWDDLGYVLQKLFLEKDETLNELYEESREASKAWQTGGYLKYMDAREEMQETFIQYTTDEYLRLQRGEITIKQYWDAITKMRSDQFQQKVGLLAGYPELKEYFDSLEADDDPAVLDEAYDAYCDAMWGDDVMTPEGDIDFEKQKEKLEEWRDMWDPTGANRIEDYIMQLRSIAYADSPELAVRLWDLTQQLDEYYAVPSNERAKWRSRPENADIEAILVFTGRVSTMQNPDVEEVIRGWAEEMGIDPDKTIPALINLMIPQDMMDKYSMTNPNHLRELNALSTEGYERRRYMVEHPEFMNYMIAENGISRYDQYGNDRFSWDTVPTVEQETMIRAYENIPSSQTTLRKAWRCRNMAGEQALIKFGFVSSAIHGSPQCELILSGSVEEVFSSMTSDAW